MQTFTHAVAVLGFRCRWRPDLVVQALAEASPLGSGGGDGLRAEVDTIIN